MTGTYMGTTVPHEPTRDCDGCGGDNPATRSCPCGRVYCGHCWCDCADWHVVVHEGHEGGYAACLMPECVQLRALAEADA